MLRTVMIGAMAFLLSAGTSFALSEGSVNPDQGKFSAGIEYNHIFFAPRIEMRANERMMLYLLKLFYLGCQLTGLIYCE